VIIIEIKQKQYTKNLTDEMLEFSKRASEVLGYDVLQTYHEKNGLSELQLALVKLEISPLNWKDVKRYQFERKVAEERKSFEEAIAYVKEPKSFWLPSSYWGERKLEEYKKPIPEFVINKALQIKEICPGVTFQVEELERDPFLAAILGEEKVYIEVWEEPEFEGKL